MKAAFIVFIAATALVLSLMSAAFASSPSADKKPGTHTLAKAYVGTDGLVHVIDDAGNDIAMPKEKGQTTVREPKLADDHGAAGWLVEEENCCTSYDIPLRLAIYRDGKRRILADGQMIFDWCFLNGGERVAMSTGTVHGMTSRHLSLYDVRSGRKLKEWNGDLDATPPRWAQRLEQ